MICWLEFGAYEAPVKNTYQAPETRRIDSAVQEPNGPHCQLGRPR